MSDTQSPVIIASPPVYGETQPVLRLAAGLVERGHHVIALVGRDFASQAANLGATVVALPEDADPDLGQLMASAERSARPPGPAQLDWDHSTVFVGAMTAQHRALQDLLEQHPRASLLCNSLFTGAWPVAFGAPGRRPRRWVAVAANPVIAADDATTPFGPVPDLEGDALVAANRAANDQFESVFDDTKRFANRQLIDLGATHQMTSYVGSIYELPDAVAALTVREFDFPRVNPLEGLTYVGILPTVDNVKDKIPEWWNEIGDAKSVVVVTQGTAANTDLSQLVEPALKALAEQDILVVAALGRHPSALAMRVPPNARTAEWVPFRHLLPHADLLITNGGFGGTQQALAAGVPVIVAGATEDKPLVAAHVDFHHVGQDLKTQTPSSRQIADGVSTVLGNAQYLSAAQKMGKAYRKTEPVSAIERLLE